MMTFYTHTTFSLLQPNSSFVDGLLDNIPDDLAIIGIIGSGILIFVVPFLLEFFS